MGARDRTSSLLCRTRQGTETRGANQWAIRGVMDAVPGTGGRGGTWAEAGAAPADGEEQATTATAEPSIINSKAQAAGAPS